jgi:hypothetical protein
MLVAARGPAQVNKQTVSQQLLVGIENRATRSEYFVFGNIEKSYRTVSWETRKYNNAFREEEYSQLKHIL